MTHHAPVSDATDHELELRGSGRWRQNYQVAYIVSFADVFFLNVTWNIWNIRKSASQTLHHTTYHRPIAGLPLCWAFRSANNALHVWDSRYRLGFSFVEICGRQLRSNQNSVFFEAWAVFKCRTALKAQLDIIQLRTRSYLSMHQLNIVYPQMSKYICVSHSFSCV